MDESSKKKIHDELLTLLSQKLPSDTIADKVTKIIESEISKREQQYYSTLDAHVEELSKTYEEISALFEINNLLSQTMNPSERLDDLATILRHTIPFREIAVRLKLQSDTIEFTKSFAKGANKINKAIEYVESGHEHETVLVEPSSGLGDLQHLLSVPIKSGSEHWGYILCADRESGIFTAADRKILESAAQQIASAVERFLRFQEELEKQRMQEQLQIARQIQSRLFPRFLPRSSFVSFNGYSSPAIQVGGDYYDILVRKDDMLVAVADVSGKGVPAALLMTSFRSALRSIAKFHADMQILVRDLNKMLLEDLQDERFITMALAQIKKDGETRLINAGHPPAIVVSNNSVKTLHASCIPLGLQEDPDCKVQTTNLRKGDLLVIYTDGVIEARNEKGEEYGMDRFSELILKNEHLSAEEIVKTIQRSLTEFMGEMPLHDDTTVVVLKYLGENIPS